MSEKTVGVIMLETRFPRIPSDIGNPQSFDFPVLYEVVRGASPQRVVREKSPELLAPFMVAGKKLVEQGAQIITTSCGFLIFFQKELQAALEVPVYTSSLLLMDELEARYGAGNVGILTISAKSLDRDLLKAAGVNPAAPIGTTEGGREFTRAILGNEPDFDVDLCRQDNVEAAMALVKEHPNLKAILLECTNMPPYAGEIEKATGLDVFSLNTLLSDLQSDSQKPLTHTGRQRLSIHRQRS